MKLNLDSNKKYVIACSFGPDSMALLDSAIKEKFKIVVAHVNYHKRDVSNLEEESLCKYCAERNIPIEVLDTSNLKCDKNFQEWAREIRYTFFKEVVEKYDADYLLTAHQQDDLIETYLMQKKRENFVKNPGIAEKINIFGINIIRPLLGYSKKELLDYDIKNNVPYSIDESNLSDMYERNKIRHHIVEKLTDSERKEILLEVSNIKPLEEVKVTHLPVKEFLSLSDQQIVLLISSFIDAYSDHRDISKSFVDEIKKAVLSKKAYVAIPLSDRLLLTKDYNDIYFINKNVKICYCYMIDKDTLIDDGLFKIDLQNNYEERGIAESDFPLTIKPLVKSDKLRIKDYDCEVRRLFIDWKMPHHLRESWPGIYNKDGKLIYVPRYRAKFVDDHKSVFRLKFVK